MSEEIAERVKRVAERIRAAEARAGRPEGAVTLCAVTKTFPAEAVAEAWRAGVASVGENRVQEAEQKRPAAEALGAALRWHLIGHLQSNKARKAAALFDVVQTVDSLSLAGRLERAAGELGRDVEVLVQVDLAAEETKTGAPEEETAAIVERLGASASLRLTGLMTIPPFLDDPEEVRPYFRRLRELRDALESATRLPLPELSMGMSHDFEVAVEEGATIVRVGTAVFGSR